MKIWMEVESVADLETLVGKIVRVKGAGVGGRDNENCWVRTVDSRGGGWIKAGGAYSNFGFIKIGSLVQIVRDATPADAEREEL